MAQVNYQDPASYKRCQKKQYEIYVCKPPINTVVINKLEQADVVKQLKKEFFTVDEVEKMQQTNPQMFGILQGFIQQGRAYVVNQNTPFVLAGTLGEMWCIDAQKLATKYTFSTGEQINPASLSKRGKDGIMSWQSVKTVPDSSKAWACHIPISMKVQVQTSWGAVLSTNLPGVSHGKGDFIIAQDAGGQPNLGDIYVVNGNIFATTYNNQGWTDCLDHRFLNAKSNNITIDQLPKFVDMNNPTGSNVKQIGKAEFRELIKKGLSKYGDVTTKLDKMNPNDDSNYIIDIRIKQSKDFNIGIQTEFGNNTNSHIVAWSYDSNGKKIDSYGTHSGIVCSVCFTKEVANEIVATSIKLLNNISESVKNYDKNTFNYFMTNLCTLFSYEFEIGEQKLSDDKGKFSFKEQNLNSERSTTIYSEYKNNTINVRAKRDGKSFNKVYKVDKYNADINLKIALANVAYLELCKELKVTPYRFITSQRYIQTVIGNANNTVSRNYGFYLKMDVSTFKRERKSEHGTNLSMSAFNTQYLDIAYGHSEELKSSYSTIIKLKINNQALQAAIQDLKNYIKTGNYNSQNYDAFRLDVKVANGNYQTTNNPAEFDLLIMNTIVKGFDIERQRQANSNAKYVKGKRDGVSVTELQTFKPNEL